jgi:hypothetical protein
MSVPHLPVLAVVKFLFHDLYHADITPALAHIPRAVRKAETAEPVPFSHAGAEKPAGQDARNVAPADLYRLIPDGYIDQFEFVRGKLKIFGGRVPRLKGKTRRRSQFFSSSSLNRDCSKI